MELFGCFIISIPIIKLVAYERQPLDLLITTRLNMIHTVFSGMLFATEQGIPIIWRVSRQEYWLIFQHCPSVWINLSTSLLLILQTKAMSAFTLCKWFSMSSSFVDRSDIWEPTYFKLKLILFQKKSKKSNESNKFYCLL